MQKCRFIMNALRVTQGYGGSYSHAGSYALDIAGEDTGSSWAYAPCDVVVKRVYGEYNAVWFETLEEVLCADGQTRKLVFMLLHMNSADLNSLGIKAGKIFRQGEKFYREGVAGKVTGAHIHLEVGEAPFTGTGWFKQTNGVWKINKQLQPHKIFFLSSDTVVKNNGGYDWKTESEITVAFDVLVIDVSKFQKKIDWKKVKADGIKGVIIRCGYRGYASAGTLVTDPYFLENIKGCTNNDIPWGVYFFSQAKNAAEGKAEAEYTLKLLQQVKPALPAFPVFIDTEYSSSPIRMGRADHISKADRTAAVKAFCDYVESQGYFAGVYASTSWYSSHLNDSELKSYTHWVAHYADKCTYAGSIAMWQYSSKGSVSGISGNVDMNHCYTDYPTVIKNAGLNGFQKDYKPVMQVFTVTASQGDIKKFVALAEELQISSYEVK